MSTTTTTRKPEPFSPQDEAIKLCRDGESSFTFIEGDPQTIILSSLVHQAILGPQGRYPHYFAHLLTSGSPATSSGEGTSPTSAISEALLGIYIKHADLTLP